ncbi:Transcription initiation factor TFIID subunit 6 [Aphelenchoides avenae]|nr:Transcription initiation factor TFIID subunit 6 [Aphelenchus avenae]
MNKPKSGHLDQPSTSNGIVHSDLEADFVTTVAEQIGIHESLPETSASEVATHVNFVLRLILAQAKKFQACARRKRMTLEDLENAMSFYGLPPQFGFDTTDDIPFRYAGTLGRDVYVRDDPELEITPVVSAPPPKLPFDPAVKSHWLVIDGVQPAVPENPTPDVPEEVKIIPTEETPATSGDGGPLLLSQMTKAMRKTEQVQIKTTTTHALSLEQQIFFKEITEAIMGGDEAKRIEALHSLQTDCGLHTLLPRFSLAIAEGVRCNIVQHNLAILIYLMRMVQALAQNPTLSLERCLHELLPAILSCVLSKQLCMNLQSDNHWALREFSSRLLGNIVKKYRLPSIRARVTNVLSQVFKDKNYSYITMYGAIYALNELGPETVKSVIVPRLQELYAAINKTLTDQRLTTVDRATEYTAAQKLKPLVESIYNKHLQQPPDGQQRVVGVPQPLKLSSRFDGMNDDIYRVNSRSSGSHTSFPASPAPTIDGWRARNGQP